MANATLVKDTTPNGGYNYSPGSGEAPLGANPTAYDLFNMHLANMISQIPGMQAKLGTSPLAGTGNLLTTEGAALAGKNLLDPNMTPQAAGSVAQGSLGAFAPAVTSINTQLAGTQAALGSIPAAAQAVGALVRPEALGPGQSQVTPGGTVLIGGVTYQQDPMTGALTALPSIPGHTGAGGGAGGGTSTGGGNVDPYMNALTRFNGGTDPQYANKVASMKATIDSLGQPTADTLNQYITGHYGKAPINGSMIMQVAQHYGLPPNWLAAQLALESHFGMVGESPANNNPGGLKWAHQPGAVQGSEVPHSEGGGYYAKFKSPMDGLFAFGDLMKRTSDVPGKTAQTSTAPMTSSVGGTFSPDVTARVAQLSSRMQTFVDAGPKGVAYFDERRIPPALVPGATIQGRNVGIPILTAQEADNIKGIGLVYDSIQKLQNLVQTTLGTGGLGRLKGSLLNPALQASEIFSGPQLKQFEQYRSQAINNLKALTAGGTTFRITQTEIDTAVSNIPGSTDNQETANADLQTLTTFMDSKLASTFPYVKSTGGTGGTSGVTPGGVKYTIH